jgi:hypothetical protein
MGTIPDWFWSAFSRATYLDISHNQISGSLPTHLDGMAFEELYLGSNSLIGPVPPFPRNITVFDISNNALSGTLPSNLEAFQNLCVNYNSWKILIYQEISWRVISLSALRHYTCLTSF